MVASIKEKQYISRKFFETLKATSPEDLLIATFGISFHGLLKKHNLVTPWLQRNRTIDVDLFPRSSSILLNS